MGTNNCQINCEDGLIIPVGTSKTRREICRETLCLKNKHGLKNLSGKKVLSIIMPWPWLILKHGKDVENRTWNTNYRGRILIHASKKPDPNYFFILKERLWQAEGKPTSHDLIMADRNWRAVNLTWCGHIVGSVELVDCVQNYSSPWAEPGMWHWLLKNPILFKVPIPARGQLGIWEYK